MLEDLLNNPAIQGGVAPFIVALLIAGAFMKVRTLAALAIPAGFLTAVALTTGFHFEPLSSTRKIILLVMVVPVIALLLDLIGMEENKKLANGFGALVFASLLWIFWPVLSRNPGDFIVPLIGYALYAVWIINVFLKLVDMPRISASLATTATNLGIGIIALVGATALLGQLGLATGAAGIAYLMTQMYRRNNESSGFTFSLSSGFIAALLLPAAVVYAKVPWTALPLVAMVPLLAFYPFDEDRHILGNVVGMLVVMAIPIGLAIYLTVRAAGPLITG